MSDAADKLYQLFSIGRISEDIYRRALADDRIAKSVMHEHMHYTIMDRMPKRGPTRTIAIKGKDNYKEQNVRVMRDPPLGKPGEPGWLDDDKSR